MCGNCCLGSGGIIMSPSDQKRLADHLGMLVEEMLEGYSLDLNGKPCVRTKEDGYCVFYLEGKGCGVHPGRPDICRAWPFFRGNLIDESSWEMVQDYCPGINPKAGHAEFVRQGKQYLRDNNLLRGDKNMDPNALIVDVD
ncbi:MAG: YkgJ family cysteine cluster protein [Proteobacteria bacterium]|nr:YkgJ family cysteine cluster protein [Pseudomonadota bacterium]MBU1612435.1 YkgJ family cysteine cluster protein [Pseudomonadota bacterium]